MPDRKQTMHSKPEWAVKREELLLNKRTKRLTEWVEELRSRFARSDKEIPYFDPLDGGIDARAWVLQTSPSQSASESGFVSRDNASKPSDQNAKALKKLLDEAFLDREITLLWNVIPWTRRSASITTTEVAELGPLLTELDELMNASPSVVVLMGVEAHKFDRHVETFVDCSRIIKTHMPDRKGPDGLALIADALTKARALV